MAVNKKGWAGFSCVCFLSRLCGGEYQSSKRQRLRYFLSRLCGGEYVGVYKAYRNAFLSRLCGGEC